MKSRLPKILAFISIGLFAVALTQNGYYIDRPNRNAWAPAWGELAVGWISVFSGTVAWLGNPLLFASWVALFNKALRAAGLFAAVALGFMLSFLLNRTIIDSEAPSYARITGYGLGYWLWLSSAATVVIGTCGHFRRPH